MKKPRVRDAIKAIQDIPEKTVKRKKFVEPTDSESMEKNLTPKPRKKNPKPQAPADDDLPAPSPKRVVRPVLANDGNDSEEALPPTKGAKKNKGKGKEVSQPQTDKTGNKGADQIRDGNVPKLKRSVFPILSASILSHVFTFPKRNHPLLLLPQRQNVQRQREVFYRY